MAFQPFVLSSTDLAIARRFAARLIETSMLPEDEANDGAILAQTSLAAIPLLVTADKHLLELDEDALLLALNDADLHSVRPVHPRRLLKALRQDILWVAGFRSKGLDDQSVARLGNRSALLDILMQHGECITDAYAVEEARRNLELKDPAHLREFEALAKRCALVTSLATGLPVTLEPKDVPILGAALAGKATHLLTGDARHFGKHFGKNIQGVKIVSPKLMADELVKGGLLRRP